MLTFLTADGNVPFLVALGLVAAVAVLELLTTLFGASLSQVVDSLLPDHDGGIGALSGADGAADPGVGGVDIAGGDGGSLFSDVLTWLRVGRVPVLILAILFLTAFGLGGFTLQWVVSSLFGRTLPGWMAAVPAFVAALPLMRIGGGALGRLMPDTLSEAVSRDTFIGRGAVILRGEARRGSPAEAKLKDVHGQTHYLLVEPDDPTSVFRAGEEVVLIGEAGSHFRAISAHPQPLAPSPADPRLGPSSTPPGISGPPQGDPSPGGPSQGG